MDENAQLQASQSAQNAMQEPYGSVLSDVWRDQTLRAQALTVALQLSPNSTVGEIINQAEIVLAFLRGGR